MSDLMYYLCGCCRPNDDESENLYTRINDDVAVVRDPPIRSLTNNLNAHENSGFDATDGVNSQNTLPENNAVNGDQKENDLMDVILERAQQNIIVVGHMSHGNLQRNEVDDRAKYYREKLGEYYKNYSEISENHANSSANILDFEAIQVPIELPISYDELSSRSGMVEDIPFSHPKSMNIRRARPNLSRLGQLMEDIPDVRKAGKLAPVPKSLLQKINECSQEIHNGIEKCQIEHRTSLIVHMDL